MRSPIPLLRILAALAALAPLAAAPPAAAGDSPVWKAAGGGAAPGAAAQAQRSSLRLLSGWTTAAGDRVAGLRIGLRPGWKTYWRVPGEAGIPPAFDWSGSGNVAALRVRWPRPVAFESFGMTTLGYRSEVVLPLEITPRDPARPVRLRLSLAYGVCSDICVPEMAELALDLPPDTQGEPAQGAGPIAAALARLPRTAEAAGATMERCALTRGPEGRRVEAVLRLPAPPGSAPRAVVEAPEPMWFEPATARTEGARVAVTARLDPASGPGWADRSALRLTLLHGDEAIEFTGCAPE